MIGFGKCKNTLDVPPDVAQRLDAYAAALSKELGLTLTRQQAFERWARLTIPEGGPTHA